MTTKQGRVAGRKALVTGGASGIGEGIARCLAAEGAAIAIADIDGARGLALATELGPSCKFYDLDVRDLQRWTAVLTDVAAHFGGLDILINNAGVGWAGGIEQQTLEEHHRIIDVNLNGVWIGIRAAIDLLSTSDAASIVNISSIDGLVGVAGVTSYVASKFAVTGMTRSLALELGNKGIRVNSVHPGVIDTPLLRSGGESAMARVGKALSHQPIPRIGTVEEVARAVLFFASDDSSYCTGATLTVDGGHIAGPFREAMT